MSLFIVLSFLFFLGSTFGWCLEVVFRRFFSKTNVDKKWINPGFCVGPYIPLYGFGLIALYFLMGLESVFNIENVFLSKVALFFIFAICLTIIEYVAGIICLKAFKVRLWDYSKNKFNIQGIICPFFTVCWGLLGSTYAFAIHPYIISGLEWLSHNLAFTFVIGFFFGVFFIDVFYSSKLLTKIKRYAKEKDIIVKYEKLKADVLVIAKKVGHKAIFLNPLRWHSLITSKKDKGVNVEQGEKTEEKV